MNTHSILQRAYRQQTLWPQIHAAVDVFLKRRASGAEAYELLWRLIHVWEAVIITLAEAATARLITLPDHAVDLRIIREKAYGKTWNEVDGALEKRIGALEGSIDRWIEVLEYVASIDAPDSGFLTVLASFLNSTSEKPTEGETSAEILPIDLALLVSAWSRACDVPSGIKGERAPVKSGLKAVNSFRNRFAHVPFPYDPIDAVYRAIEACTEQLFAATNGAATHRGALSGCIAFKQSILKGSATEPDPMTKDTAEPNAMAKDSPKYVHGYAKKAEPEVWSAEPFVHIDNMLRPYVLTRLRDEAGLWEYTRYLAESNAVIALAKPEALERFPIPCDAEYARTCDLPEEPPADTSETTEVPSQPEAPKIKVQDMGEATSAIRRRDFQPAITYLEQRLSRNPHYHVAWLKLGLAKREWAVDLRYNVRADHPADPDAISQLLKESLEALANAKQHSDRQYKAEAHYQASKTHYRLWQFSPDNPNLEQARHLNEAIREAENAAAIFPENRYESWVEYLVDIQKSTPTEAG